MQATLLPNTGENYFKMPLTALLNDYYLVRNIFDIVKDNNNYNESCAEEIKMNNLTDKVITAHRDKAQV